MLSLLAALNTGLTGSAIRRLTDTQWWALSALISQWLDINEGADLLAFTDDLGELSRAEVVAAIILLLATEYLKLEITLPQEVLTHDPLPESAGLELGIDAVDVLPEGDTDEAEEIHALIATKLCILESAVRSAQRAGPLH